MSADRRSTPGEGPDRARRHDRLPAAAGRGGRARGAAGGRQRGRRRGRHRLRPGRGRSHDVRHRRIRGDARLPCRRAQGRGDRLLRARRRADPPRAVGEPVHPPGGGPLRVRPPRLGERLRLPERRRARDRGRAGRGAAAARNAPLEGGPPTGDRGGPEGNAGHRHGPRVLASRRGPGRRRQRPAHPVDGRVTARLHQGRLPPPTRRDDSEPGPCSHLRTACPGRS